MSTKRHTRGFGGVIWLLMIVAVVVSCSDRETEERQAQKELERRTVILPSSGEPVARVNGVPITREQVDAARSRMAEGTTDEEALAQLIEVEALAQEAMRRDLQERPAIRAGHRRALVQRLLEVEVEQGIPPESVEDSLVKKTYDNFALQFFVPELVTASHLLIELPEKEQNEEQLAKATRLAEQVSRVLRASENPLQLLESLQLEVQLRGFVGKVNRNLTFPEQPIPPLTGERSPYQSVVQEFADAAFELRPDDRVSPPVRTSYGVHVIVLQERSAARRPPFDAVADDIRADYVKRRRQQRLRNLIERLYAVASVETDEQPIVDMAVRANELSSAF